MTEWKLVMIASKRVSMQMVKKLEIVSMKLCCGSATTALKKH